MWHRLLKRQHGSKAPYKILSTSGPRRAFRENLLSMFEELSFSENIYLPTDIIQHISIETLRLILGPSYGCWAETNTPKQSKASNMWILYTTTEKSKKTYIKMQCNAMKIKSIKLYMIPDNFGRSSSTWSSINQSQ